MLEAGNWERLEKKNAERKGRTIWGVDLSASFHMSAVCCLWETGRLEALAAFPKQPSLQARGLKDGVDKLYIRMAERGELIQAGLRIVDVF